MQAACTLFGYTKGEMEGKNVNILMPAPYSARHDSYLKNFLTTGQAHVMDKYREVIALHKVWQHMHVTCLIEILVWHVLQYYIHKMCG